MKLGRWGWGRFGHYFLKSPVFSLNSELFRTTRLVQGGPDENLSFQGSQKFMSFLVGMRFLLEASG